MKLQQVFMSSQLQAWSSRSRLAAVRSLAETANEALVASWQVARPEEERRWAAYRKYDMFHEALKASADALPVGCLAKTACCCMPSGFGQKCRN